MSSKRLKIVLLAPFPIRSRFGSRLKFSLEKSSEHPATWVINLLQLLSLRSSQFELHLISLSPHLAHDACLEENGITYHLLKGARFSRQALGLYQYDKRKIHAVLSEIRPDLIEAFGTEGPYAYSGVTSPYPCLVKVQGIAGEIVKQTRFSPKNPQWMHLFVTQFFEKYTIQKSKIFLVENHYASEYIRKFNQRAKIYEIPNLINPIFFSVERKTDTKNPILLYIGTITKRKGSLDLLIAFNQIHKKHENVKLVMVGGVNSEIHGKIEKLLIHNHIKEDIEIPGSQTADYIANKFSDASFLVHPSWVDSSPNSVYEAMAAGLPVVAYRVGGLPYMIEDRQSGILVEPHHIDDLARGMDYFLSHPEEIARMGDYAKQRMREKLNPDVIVQKTIDAYMQVWKDSIHK